MMHIPHWLLIWMTGVVVVGILMLVVNHKSEDNDDIIVFVSLAWPIVLLATILAIVATPISWLFERKKKGEK